MILMFVQNNNHLILATIVSFKSFLNTQDAVQSNMHKLASKRPRNKAGVKENTV